MDGIEKLYKKKRDIVAQMFDIKDEAKKAERLMNEEELKRWNDLDKDIVNIDANIKAEKAAENLTALKAEQEPKTIKQATHKEQHMTAFEDYIRHGVGMGAENKAFLDAVNRANVQNTTAATGGNTIPIDLWQEIVVALEDAGGMREAATVITTAKGNELDIITNDDTSNDARQVSESTDMATSSTATQFAHVTLNAYNWTSDLLVITQELLQDSDFDIIGHIRMLMIKRFERGLNAAYTSASGSSTIQGFLSATPPTGVTKGEDATKRGILVTDLENLRGSLEPAYRRKGTWMFNDTTFSAIKALTATDGRPTWNPDISKGDSNTLFGHPVVINQDMEDLHPTYKPVAFGDFSRYYIRDVKGMTFGRLNERYAEKNQVGFFGILRTDGDVVASATDLPIKYIRNATT